MVPMLADTSAMGTFLGTMSEFVGKSMEWVAQVLKVVTANPPLTVLCLAMPITGFVVGLLKRMTNL